MISKKLAKDVSIYVWEKRAEGEKVSQEELENEFGIMPRDKCGFCERFREIWHTKNCEECPLHEPNLEDEDHMYFQVPHLPCSREFYKWVFWSRTGHLFYTDSQNDYTLGQINRWKKYWANKVLESIKSVEIEELEIDSGKETEQ